MPERKFDRRGKREPPSRQKQCPWQGMQVFCGPGGMKGAPDRLYHNNGDGTFTDVTKQAGVEDRDLLYGLTAT